MRENNEAINNEAIVAANEESAGVAVMQSNIIKEGYVFNKPKKKSKAKALIFEILSISAIAAAGIFDIIFAVLSIRGLITAKGLPFWIIILIILNVFVFPAIDFLIISRKKRKQGYAEHKEDYITEEGFMSTGIRKNETAIRGQPDLKTLFIDDYKEEILSVKEEPAKEKAEPVKEDVQPVAIIQEEEIISAVMAEDYENLTMEFLINGFTAFLKNNGIIANTADIRETFSDVISDPFVQPVYYYRKADNPVPDNAAYKAQLFSYLGYNYPLKLSKVCRECEKTYCISEGAWKKLDKFEEWVNARTPYNIGNKQWRNIERYTSAYLACGGTEPDALDNAIALKLLPQILPLIKSNQGIESALKNILNEECSACINTIKRLTFVGA